MSPGADLLARGGGLALAAVGLAYLAVKPRRLRSVVWAPAVVASAALVGGEGGRLMSALGAPSSGHWLTVALAGGAVATVLSVRRQFPVFVPGPAGGSAWLVAPLVGAVIVGIDVVWIAAHVVGRSPQSAAVLLAGGAAIAVALALMLHPPAAPVALYDRDLAARLVARYGTDTLANFALRQDRRYFFSSDCEAVIAYVVLGGFALASGDPIGRPGSIDNVIGEFVEHCHERGWACAFLSVREATVEQYTRHRLQHFYFGDEALLECQSLRLGGKRNKSTRQAVQRVARTFRFQMLPEDEASPELVQQLNDLSDRWRGRAPERGFSMALSLPVGSGGAGAELCVAIDQCGQPGGFLRLLPVPADPGSFTLDMMRRAPGVPNGMTEYLIANTAQCLGARQIRLISLNFAVMGRLYRPDWPPAAGDRALRAFFALFNPFLPFKSLYDFNRKFTPQWDSRVLVYESHVLLPVIAVLYFGLEGYLSWPLVGRWFDPRRFHPTPAARVEPVGERA